MFSVVLSVNKKPYIYLTFDCKLTFKEHVIIIPSPLRTYGFLSEILKFLKVLVPSYDYTYNLQSPNWNIALLRGIPFTLLTQIY